MKLSLLESDFGLRQLERLKDRSPDDLADYYVASARAGMPQNNIKTHDADPVTRQVKKMRSDHQAAIASSIQANRSSWSVYDHDLGSWSLRTPDNDSKVITIYYDMPQDGRVFIGPEWRSENEDTTDLNDRYQIGRLSHQALEYFLDLDSTLETEHTFWGELNSIYARHLSGSDTPDRT